MVRSAMLQASSFNASAVYAGLACRWAGSHQAEGKPRQPECARISGNAVGNAQQPDPASLRGSSLEVSCTGTGIPGAGTTTPALTA